MFGIRPSIRHVLRGCAYAVAAAVLTGHDWACVASMWLQLAHACVQGNAKPTFQLYKPRPLGFGCLFLSRRGRTGCPSRQHAANMHAHDTGCACGLGARATCAATCLPNHAHLVSSTWQSQPWHAHVFLTVCMHACMLVPTCTCRANTGFRLPRPFAFQRIYRGPGSPTKPARVPRLPPRQQRQTKRVRRSHPTLTTMI